jgi:thiamine biosynthesis lipoprotein
MLKITDRSLAGQISALIFIAGLFLGQAAFAQEDPYHTLVFSSLHTKVEIKIPNDSGSAQSAQALAMAAAQPIGEVNRLLSPFGPESDIFRLNQAPPKTWVKIQPLTAEAVSLALSWREKTGGLFEPGIGPVKKLFRFNGETLERWPDEEEIQKALKLVGTGLAISEDGQSLSFALAGQSLDLGGIAKGYAADLAARAIIERGGRNALINCGGEMRVLGLDTGRKPSGPWLVGLTDPLGRSVQFQAELSHRAVASSGNYRSFFLYQGQRYSHIIHPASGRPITDTVAGVSLFLPESPNEPFPGAAADALATAFSLMGLSGAREYLSGPARQYFPNGLELVLFLKGHGPGELEAIRLSLSPDGLLSQTHP